MRPIAIALALAAATTLPGCFSGPCNSPTVTIAWELHGPSGAAWDCASATTQYVDVYIGALPPARFSCAAYGGTVDVGGLGPGQYPATVEGIDADGFTIWSRDQFPVVVGDCNANSVYTARPGEATLALDYFYPTGATCSGGYMWYAVWDVVAGQTISAISTASAAADKTRYLCGGPIPAGQTYQVEIAVPFGTYELDWMQEVTDPLNTHVPVFQACGPLSAAVTGVGVQQLPVYMTPYTAACPPIP